MNILIRDVRLEYQQPPFEKKIEVDPSTYIMAPNGVHNSPYLDLRCYKEAVTS